MNAQHDEIATHLTSGAVVVYAIQWLKAQGWFPWLTDDTARLNRIVSAVAAAAVAFGVSWTGDASTGWTIHVPALAMLISGFVEWAKQYVLQQLIYDAVVQKAGGRGAATTSEPQPRA